VVGILLLAISFELLVATRFESVRNWAWTEAILKHNSIPFALFLSIAFAVGVLEGIGGLRDSGHPFASLFKALGFVWTLIFVAKTFQPSLKALRSNFSPDESSQNH
jgi:hypothetical protein